MFGNAITRSDIAEVWDVVKAKRLERAKKAAKESDFAELGKAMNAAAQADLCRKTTGAVAAGLASPGLHDFKRR